MIGCISFGADVNGPIPMEFENVQILKLKEEKSTDRPRGGGGLEMAVGLFPSCFKSQLRPGLCQLCTACDVLLSPNIGRSFILLFCEDFLTTFAPTVLLTFLRVR